MRKHFLFSVLVMASVAIARAENPVHVDRWELAEHRMKWSPVRVQGAISMEVVAMEVEVDTQGRVTSVTLVPPMRLWPPGVTPKPVPRSPFADRAIAEMRSRRYIPFEQDGQPNPATFQDFVVFLPPERVPSVHRPFPEIKDWNTLRIKLKRGACFGSCPTYSLEVRGDGTVRYDGHRYVAVTGEHDWLISRQDLEALVDLFRKADFFSLEPMYEAGVSDVPTNTISLAFDGHDLSVEDQYGAAAGMPESASALIGEIDRYAGVSKWTRGDENTIAALRRENFDFHSREAGTILAVAAKDGTLVAIQDLAAAGTPLGVGTKTFWGGSVFPLQSAVENNNIEVLKFLIKVGASRNDFAAKKAALDFAIQIGRTQAIALLREYIAATK